MLNCVGPHYAINITETRQNQSIDQLTHIVVMSLYNFEEQCRSVLHALGEDL